MVLASFFLFEVGVCIARDGWVGGVDSSLALVVMMVMSQNMEVRGVKFQSSSFRVINYPGRRDLTRACGVRHARCESYRRVEFILSYYA